MYTVEDETFQQARAIVSAVAAELSGQHGLGPAHAVDLRELIRLADPSVAMGGETEYVRTIADRLEKSFPIEELFPRKRRAPSA
jgi:hypothetical protein